MKQKLIFRLIVGALAGAAATASYAGQIQASSTSIAREVITADNQPVTSPTVSYRFFGDVDARLNAQTFQVQFTLGGNAKWDKAGAFSHIKVTDGVTADVLDLGTDYEVVELRKSDDDKTLYATITVFAAKPKSLVKQPLISIASDYVTPENNPTIVNLKQIVGTVEECDVSVKTLPVSVKHYVALSQPTQLAVDSNATPDEHLRSGSTNATTLITFPTNILVNVVKSSTNAKLDVRGNNMYFTGSTYTGEAPWTSSFSTQYIADLGQVYLTQNAQGYDSDLKHEYLLSEMSNVGTAANIDGKVEVKSATVKVAASQGFVQGGRVFLAYEEAPVTNGTPAVNACNANEIATTSVPVTSANMAGPITLTIPTNQVLNAFGANKGSYRVHVCYDVKNATTPVPASSFNVTAATLVKASAGEHKNEQNNFCKGPLYPLSGSIKIDVRNYASNGRQDGWLSVIRLINNSETDTMDVYGQYIQRDGKYGKWGKLATLAPRAVLQMLPQDVDAKLTNAPASPVSGENATNAVATEGDAPRLRITSDNGSTLRVQNYLYNPASQNFIEASGSQGVDFTYDDSRSGTIDTTLDQDAQAGLNHGN
ncbi:hypothetical protein ACDA63_15145 [Uliginosibacterium sp. sgz301328]|uniref:hypothetical protein n=1 Tax=Uliginosibacterium sp. sgz301328 TaxID=3243764 RepID=UPI00359EE3B7